VSLDLLESTWKIQCGVSSLIRTRRDATFRDEVDVIFRPDERSKMAGIGERRTGSRQAPHGCAEECGTPNVLFRASLCHVDVLNAVAIDARPLEINEGRCATILRPPEVTPLSRKDHGRSQRWQSRCKGLCQVCRRGIETCLKSVISSDPGLPGFCPDHYLTSSSVRKTGDGLYTRTYSATIPNSSTKTML
jgi:hypothetical protein